MVYSTKNYALYFSREGKCTMDKKMYLFDCGSMWLDNSLIVANSHLATSKNRSPAAEWTEIPVCVFLIDTPDGKILFDVGCDGVYQGSISPDADRVSPYVFTEQQLLPARLEECGVSFEDIKYVVVSHLHCDHIGYLHMCTNAEVFVNETEFIHAMKHYGLKRPYGAYTFNDFDNFLKARLNWTLIPDDEKFLEITEGVTIVNLGPGHSYGMLGLHVELKNSGNFFLVSDALYTETNLGPPPRVAGIVHDTVGYVKTAGNIAKFAKEHKAQIVFGHNMEQFRSMREQTGGVFD